MSSEEDDAIEKLSRFVTGEMTPAAFQHALANEPVFAALLVYRKPPRFAGGTSSSSEFLLEMDCENPYKVARAREHARAVLLELGRDVAVDRSDEPMLAAINRLRPRWVEVPPATMKAIIASAGDRRGKDLKVFVGEAITRRFRCIKKRPVWLQSPDWQYDDDREPMIFAGQIELDGLYHDTSTLYVFVDPRSMRVKHVIQST